MNYAQFKQSCLKIHHSSTSIKAIFELTDLKVVTQSKLAENEAWTCQISPTNGQYLPQVIDITGTKSRFAFKYDYTTGVIFIPSDEITGDITITAIADTVNNNIPAVMEVHTTTRTNTDGVNEYPDENCLFIDVYPCRGSEVSVTYGGITKTVVGDISTSSYDSPKKTVWFGAYLGQTDGVTATSGTLTISGAYESYSESTYVNDKNTVQAYTHIDTITQLGAIRWLPVCFNKDNITFDREIDKIIAPYVNEGGDVTITFNNKVNIITGYLCNNAEGLGLAGGGNDSNITVYYNNIDWDWWSQGDRQYYGYYYQIGGDYEHEDESVTPYFNGVVYSNISEVPLSDKITHIGKYAFYCFGITTLTIPDSVTHIGDSAFIGCNNLTDISIGKCTAGEDSIAKSGISSLYNLKNIYVSSENELYCSLNGILYSKNMESIICYPSAREEISFAIPQEVKTIKNNAFYNAIKLESITIPNSVETIGEYAFYNCNKLKSLALPDNITRIERYAFARCSSVENFSFSGKETYIGSNAFNDFGNSATSIVIPDSVTKLDNYAFYYCNAQSITIGSSVVSIGTNCFYGNIKNIVIRATTPPTLGSSCFSTSKLQITVPKGCAELYKNAEGWSTFADYIVEEV